MATGGQVSTTTGAATLVLGNDSVRIACRGVTGVTYTSLDDIATNCNHILIDSDHGTRGTTTTNAKPTRLTHFRGYPRAEVTMNFDVVPVTVGFITKDDYVVDAPTLNYAVGFPITVTLGITERRSDTNAILSTHNETFTFNANSTTVNSSTITETSGYYVLNDNKSTASYEVDMSVTYSASKTTYQTENYPQTQSLTYTDASPYEYTIYEPTGGSGCSYTYDSGSPITVYSSDSPLAVSSEVFTDSALTTEITSFANYILDPTQSEGTKFDYFYYNGAIQFYNVCDL